MVKPPNDSRGLKFVVNHLLGISLFGYEKGHFTCFFPMLLKRKILMDELVFSSLACNRISDIMDYDPLSQIICYAGSNFVAILPTNQNHIQTQCQNTLKITCVKFTRISHRLFVIAGSVDRNIVVWELGSKGNVLGYKILKIHEYGLVSIGVLNDAHGLDSTHTFFCTADSGSGVSVLKLSTKSNDQFEIECIQSLRVKPILAQSLCMSYLPTLNATNENQRVPMMLLGGTDNNLHVYICSHGVFEKKLDLGGHTDWITSISVANLHATGPANSQNYLLIATASQDTFTRLWRVRVKPHTELTEESKPENKVKQLSTKAFELIIDHKTYEFMLDAVLVGHDDWVMSVSWQPVDRLTSTQPLALITASADKSIIIWKPDSHSDSWTPQERVGEVGGRTLGFYGSRLSATGDTIYANGYNGAIHIWKKEIDERVVWKPTIGLSGHSMAVQDIKWDPSGSYLASVSLDQTARIVSTWKHDGIETWHEIGRSQIHGYNLNTLAFISKYQYISGADEKVLRIFDAPKTFAQSLHGLGGVEEDIAVLEARPVGANLPALGLSNKAFFEGEAAKTISAKDMYAVEEVSASSCLPLVQPPFEEHLLQNTLWPETEKLYGHVYEIVKVATNKQGTLIASAAKATKPEHSTIRIWSTSKWIEVCAPLKYHSLTVTALCFSHSGQHLLAAGRDRSWSLFDISDSEGEGSKLLCSQESAHSRIVWDCDFTPDDLYFVTGSRDKTVI